MGNGGGISRPSGVHRFSAGAEWRARRREPEARAAEPEVDAAGVERVEEPELLDHRQRGVVPHEHGAGADPDAAR